MFGDDKLEVLSDFRYLSGIFFAWSGCKLAAAASWLQSQAASVHGASLPNDSSLPTIHHLPKDKYTQHV